ncbi:MAG: SpoVR family protein, partial [Planctomycetota bacterium]
VMEQKLVMAHVFGHADFFKHNLWFSPTDRRMLNRMNDHGERIRQAMKALGQDRVENFLDDALSLDNLIDPFLPLRRKMRQASAEQAAPQELRESPSERALKSLERASRSPLEETSFVAPQTTDAVNVNPPTYDVLGFLAEEAPLERWQRDLLRIVREEAYYFSPQRMTKIMNEGWASFWHSRMLTEGVLDPDEIIDFADCHSGATAAQPGQLNPYKLGIDLFRHAEEKGLDIFRLRRMHNDTSFLDELIDEEFAAKSQLFVMGHNSRTGRTEVLDRDWQGVKATLLQQLTHGGLPQIELVDRDFEGRGELLFEHHHDGRDLELSVSAESLRRIAAMWQRPVHLRTQEEGEDRHFVAEPNAEVRLVEKPAVVESDPESDSEFARA